MSKDFFQGKWTEISGKLKQKYAELNDDDLQYQEGQEEELMGRLQKKLGKGKEEVKKIIDEL
ncbi:MAG: CsbD family protein [Cyclobacteriaceae bacterium]|nr:CsbD family protein [Cyclobacteriaceae bacterium]MCH8516768.1 CsbD family protein [Cyclobacteriaceae bacterium]